MRFNYLDEDLGEEAKKFGDRVRGILRGGEAGSVSRLWRAEYFENERKLMGSIYFNFAAGDEFVVQMYGNKEKVG